MSDRPRNGEEAAMYAATMFARVFNREVSRELLQAWKTALGDLTVDEIASATATLLRTCKFMPAPSELRQAVFDGEFDSVESRAVKAFGEVSEAIASIGAYCSVDFEDPIINATIRNLGGWPRIGDMTCEEFEKWYRKDFISTYRALFKNPPSPTSCERLAGLHFTANGEFHDHDQPVVVASESPLSPKLVTLRADVDRQQAVRKRLSLPRVQFCKIDEDE